MDKEKKRLTEAELKALKLVSEDCKARLIAEFKMLREGKMEEGELVSLYCMHSGELLGLKLWLIASDKQTDEIEAACKEFDELYEKLREGDKHES